MANNKKEVENGVMKKRRCEVAQSGVDIRNSPRCCSRKMTLVLEEILPTRHGYEC